MTDLTDSGQLLHGAVTDRVLAELHAGRLPDLAALAREFPELVDRLESHVAQLALIVECGLDDPPKDNASAGGWAEVLADYRVVREIGRGGMGVVYEDRKSTRLNSSHLGISYAVFCLKKK